MVYDPVLKKEYDRLRNLKLKEEYMKNNPNYKPVRSQQKDKRDAIKNGISVKTNPAPIDSGFGNILSDYYANQPKPPAPKPKWNPKGIEAPKSRDYYSEDDENEPTPKINVPKVRFY